MLVQVSEAGSLHSGLCCNGAVGGRSSALGVAVWEGGEDAPRGVAPTSTPAGVGIRETV